MEFLAAKIVGAYEKELHRVVEEIIATEFAQVVNVGAGEGYYAVGLAMRLGTVTHVTAFERSMGARALCSEMACLNCVSSRTDLAGECDPDRLRGMLQAGAVVVCDCEGYELELLRPELVPQLLSATMLVELHPFVHAEIETIMRRRFEATHHIAMIGMQQRDAAEWPELAGWPARAAELVLSEGWRSDEEWRASERRWAYITPTGLQRRAESSDRR